MNKEIEFLVQEIMSADSADTEAFFVDYQDINQLMIEDRSSARNNSFASFLKRKILVKKTIGELQNGNNTP